MRSLEIDELISYLETMKTSEVPDGYSSDDVRRGVAKSLISTGVLHDFMALASEAPDKETATMSLWTTGFQMGRLFEHRFNEGKAMEAMFPDAVKNKGDIN